MIWMNGQIHADQELSIPATDRVFEHGIGLFETFRTWNGQARLWGRHLARLSRSAQKLGFKVDPRTLPEVSDVQRLRDQPPIVGGDVMIRITMTGGEPGPGSARVWMRSSPLVERPSVGWKVTVVDSPVSPFDTLSRHKTLNYWSRRLAFEHATGDGFDEAVLATRTPSGRAVIEGSRTNLFVVKNGRLVTAGEDAPILPGILRGLVLEVAAKLGVPVEVLDWRTILTNPEPLDLVSADEVFLTNSVRGIVSVSDVDDRILGKPGTLTRLLQRAFDAWLMGDDT